MKKILFIAIALIAIVLWCINASIEMEREIMLNSLDHRDLEKGRSEMYRHKVVFTGISRDNSFSLLNLKRYIKKTGHLFKDYRVLIAENDSSDSTKIILSNWEKEDPRIKAILQNYNNKKRPNISFLAHMRNQYISAIMSNPEYEDFDIVIILDWDMHFAWDIRALESSFAHYSSWDMVCSNTIIDNGTMRDVFAFRSKSLPYVFGETIDYWDKINKEGWNKYPVDLGLIPVDSCFGGLAIYKKKFINGCLYESINGGCEHIPFHKCMKKNGAKIFMNSAQILRSSNHNYEFIRLAKLTILGLYFHIKDSIESIQSKLHLNNRHQHTK